MFISLVHDVGIGMHKQPCISHIVTIITAAAVVVGRAPFFGHAAASTACLRGLILMRLQMRRRTFV